MSKNSKSFLEISPLATECANNAILITGSARSGTTIMGQLISSFNRIEFSYEPPMLLTIFTLIEQTREHHWRMLYETYLYEEFLLNVLAGRVFNFNKFDNSAILKVKSSEEIDGRLNLNLSKADAEQFSQDRIVAFKIPDVISFVPSVKKYYPSMRVIVMLRDAVGTMNSAMQRGWFREDSENKNLIWPFHRLKNLQVPYWVKLEDIEYWLSLSEIDRAAYYYIRINENVRNIEGRIEIKYIDLVYNAHTTASGLAEKLGVSFGDKTAAIIEKIKRTDKVRDLGLIGKIRDELRGQVKHYSDLSV
jgi:hypothetical protein